ncbi:MAG: zinc-ribbon and DUF3426 domain-containing protein [Candidatus Porifericomitaceae bacterium WSBS_2022_MAG_OTU9]
MALFTTCPGCNRQFQLRADHLSAASGEVRCGYCKLKFNALKHLDDTPALPLRSKAKPPPPKEVKKVLSKPRRRLVGMRAGSKSGEDPDFVVRAYELQLSNYSKAEQRAAAYRPLWLVGVAVLSLLFAVQSLWHYRNSLYVRYPDLIPYARELCWKLPCEPIRQQSLDNIELVNRDVRFHPQYQQTLLVNATILNRSKSYMPLPLMELQVYDTKGEALAWRRFTPEQYMGGDRHLQGMPPGESIYVVLELAGNVAEADGFEIGFAYPQSLLFFAR